MYDLYVNILDAPCDSTLFVALAAYKSCEMAVKGQTGTFRKE